jgi:hypothetical protein
MVRLQFAVRKYFQLGSSPVVRTNKDICIIATPLMKLGFFDADF